MLKTRVIPCLLLMNGRLVKTMQFKKPNYVGDPINIVRIFNTKEVDEIVFLDIAATSTGKPPAFQLLSEIASECFMPFAYGGGIRSLDQVKTLFSIGAEKVIVNTIALEDKTFISRIADRYGSQSVVVSMDVKKTFFGKYRVFSNNGKKKTLLHPVQHAIDMEKQGAGEILLTSINCDGMMRGYDINLIKAVAEAVNIPVIASGGAGDTQDFVKAVKEGGASAVAAGSMVVYQGKNRAVLTRFPKHEELAAILP